MALLRREVVVFVAVAAAVAVGLVFAVRGCGGDEPATESFAPRTETVVAVLSPEAAVAEHLRRRRPELAGGRVVLSQTITAEFGVVAVQKGRRVVAFPVRRGRSGWVVQLRSPVRLRALRPDPGERVVQRTQLAAEILADARILEAGLWMDGLAVPTNGSGPSPRRLTMYTEAPQPLRRGPHVVVAFASTAADAAALAWTFEVE